MFKRIGNLFKRFYKNAKTPNIFHKYFDIFQGMRFMG